MVDSERTRHVVCRVIDEINREFPEAEDLVVAGDLVAVAEVEDNNRLISLKCE